MQTPELGSEVVSEQKLWGYIPGRIHPAAVLRTPELRNEVVSEQKLWGYILEPIHPAAVLRELLCGVT